MSPATDWLSAVVALGSNLGDRLVILQRGLDLVAARDLVVVRGVSPLYETDPVGGPAQSAYLNAVCLLETGLAADALLAALHEVEAACGRVREQRWGPRTLDLDLVSMDGLVSSDPALVLPHPRACERAFVLVPWLDVDPAAVLPGRGPVTGLLASVGVTGVRRWTGGELLVPAGRGPA